MDIKNKKKKNKIPWWSTLMCHVSLARRINTSSFILSICLSLCYTRTRGPEISHTRRGNFHLMRYTWVISPSTDGVLAECLLQTFRKRSVSFGGGGTWLNEAVCLQSCNCVFSSPLFARLPFSWESSLFPLIKKYYSEKSDTIYLAPALRWKTGAALPRGASSETQTHHCYSSSYLKPRGGEEDFLFRETLKTLSTKRRERKLPDSASWQKSSVLGFLCRSKSQRRARNTTLTVLNYKMK